MVLFKWFFFSKNKTGSKSQNAGRTLTSLVLQQWFATVVWVTNDQCASWSYCDFARYLLKPEAWLVERNQRNVNSKGQSSTAALGAVHLTENSDRLWALKGSERIFKTSTKSALFHTLCSLSSQDKSTRHPMYDNLNNIRNWNVDIY